MIPTYIRIHSSSSGEISILPHFPGSPVHFDRETAFETEKDLYQAYQVGLIEAYNQSATYFFVYSFQFPTMQQIGEDLIHVLDQLK